MKPIHSTVTWLLVLVNAVILKMGYLVNESWYLAFIIALPALGAHLLRNRLQHRMRQELKAGPVFIHYNSVN